MVFRFGKQRNKLWGFGWYSASICMDLCLVRWEWNYIWTNLTAEFNLHQMTLKQYAGYTAWSCNSRAPQLWVWQHVVWGYVSNRWFEFCTLIRDSSKMLNCQMNVTMGCVLPHMCCELLVSLGAHCKSPDDFSGSGISVCVFLWGYRCDWHVEG